MLGVNLGDSCLGLRVHQELFISRSGSYCISYTRNSGKEKIGQWMRLKGYEIGSRMEWFDKNLWQDKLGQYSTVHYYPELDTEEGCCIPRNWIRKDQLETCVNNEQKPLLSRVADQLGEMVGLQYIKHAVEDLLWSTNTKGGASVRLHDDVNECIAEFLIQMKSRRIREEHSPLVCCWQ